MQEQLKKNFDNISFPNSRNANNQRFENLKYDYNLRMTSGVLLLLNSPSKMQFGIDNSKWKIGDKFMGIKLIPEGAHYISYALSDEDYAIKQGFFIYVNKKNLIHIRKWDIEVEDFVILKEEDEKNFSIGVDNLEFDSFLGNYPFEQFDNWKDLSKYISVEVIEKIQPISKKYITSSKEYDDFEVVTQNNLLDNKSKNLEELLKLKNPNTYKDGEDLPSIQKIKNIEETTAAEKSKKESDQKKMDLENEVITNINKDNHNQDKNIESSKNKNKQNFFELQENIKKSLSNFDNIKSDLYFTEIPKKKLFLATEKIEHSLITKNNIDKSFIFEELLIKIFKGSEEDLLGEFQFSFVTFYIAEIYESFEQWKNLCLLILNCQSVIFGRSQFFCSFIELLYNQFRQFPKDFFEDELSSNNFFRKSVENFIIFIKDEDNMKNFCNKSKIYKMVLYFEKFLNEYFGFYIKDENTKIIEKYLNNKNFPKDSDFNKINYKNIAVDDDDEMPVIVDEEEIKQILESSNNLYNLQIETGDNTVNNTDTEQDDYENMHLDRF